MRDPAARGPRPSRRRASRRHRRGRSPARRRRPSSTRRSRAPTSAAVRRSAQRVTVQVRPHVLGARSRSSAWSATRSTPTCAIRCGRPSTCRPTRQAARRSSSAPPAIAAALAPVMRRTLAKARPDARIRLIATEQELVRRQADPRAAAGDALGVRGGASRCCCRPSASTASCTTRSCCSSGRLGSGWRWARARRRSSATSPAGCSVAVAAGAGDWPRRRPAARQLIESLLFHVGATDAAVLATPACRPGRRGRRRGPAAGDPRRPHRPRPDAPRGVAAYGSPRRSSLAANAGYAPAGSIVTTAL